MKKGFTLIEIIVCITLLVVIGAGSFIGVQLVNKNIKIKRLDEITDKILLAAEVYIETHQDTYNQIYKNKNGAIIPLNLLVNEGLLSLDNSDLKLDDVGDEYVLSMLSNNPNNNSECIDIKTVTSWNETSSEPIYICIKGDGTSNLVSVGMGENLSNAVQEKYYYKGYAENNYVKIDGKIGTYRILYIDTDDSIVLVNPSGNFSGIFNESQILPISGCTNFYYSNKNFEYVVSCTGDLITVSHKSDYNNQYCSSISVSDSLDGVGITSRDIENSFACNESVVGVTGSTNNGTLYGDVSAYGYSTASYTPFGWLSLNYNPRNTYYKIHLNPCMKIKSGTGDIATPFVIKPFNC